MTQESQLSLANIDARLQRLEAQNDRIIKALEKRNKKSIFRSQHFDFLSCLGYAVGLGNVWRFPYLCYKNGGGAFFIPYFIMLIFVGMPMFFLELSLGQFTSCGSFACWKYAPIFQVCLDYVDIVQDSVECFENGWSPKDNGACYDRNGTVVALYDQSLAKQYDIERKLPSAEYFERYVTRSYYSDGLDDLGPMQWKIVLCYLLAFFLVSLALSKSIKSSGKVVYFTATFPYIVLAILLVRGLYLDGHKDGINFFITPDLDKLSDSAIWKDAAVQIFFSLSTSWGGLLTLASYNRFHNDILSSSFHSGDSVVVSLCNSATSIFAGFVIFSYLGNLANILGLPVDDVAESGPSLAFIVYPYAVTKLPAAPFWSIIFFLMLITLGVDSKFVLVETVITSIMDRFPKWRVYNFLVVLIVCSIFFLLGLTMTTEGGIYMLEVMDTYSAGWNVMFLAICECISLFYVYGIRRFLMDIETMVGKRVCGFAPFYICKFWWAFNWGFVTPIVIAATMIFSWVDYTDMEGEKYPEWAHALGWLMTLAVVVAAILGAIVAISSAHGSLNERIKMVTGPSTDWGPALVKHRELVAKYVPGFDIDPWGEGLRTRSMDVSELNNLEMMNEKDAHPQNDSNSQRM